jgi:hypothetical protein
VTQSDYKSSDLSSDLNTTTFARKFTGTKLHSIQSHQQLNKMCHFKLRVCPYPHQDQISTLIFNPDSAGKWVHCGKAQPWGRLSCGDLIIEHCLVDLNPQYAIEDLYPLTRCPNGKPKPSEQIVDDLRVLDGKNGAKHMTGICKWCTAVLKLVATKSKEIQKQSHVEIAELEKKMDADDQVRDTRKEAKEVERQLDMLRAKVWMRANHLLQEVKPAVDKSNGVVNGERCKIKIKTDSDEWETVDN